MGLSVHQSQRGSWWWSISVPTYGPQGDFRGVVKSRVPLENLRTNLDQEGKLQYNEAHDWLLLDVEAWSLSRPLRTNQTY